MRKQGGDQCGALHTARTLPHTQDSTTQTTVYYTEDYTQKGLAGQSLSCIQGNTMYRNWLRVFFLFSVPYTLYNAQDNTTHEIGDTHL